MKLFKPSLIIKSKEGVLHFKRWTILNLGFIRFYLHGIYHKDDELHLHNHPWNYISIILKGEFTEKSVNERGINQYKEFKQFQVVKRNHDKYHKIYKIDKGPVYTFFIAYGKRKDWGYLVKGNFVNNIYYRELKKSGYFKKK